jgi:hypothetical protein
MSVEDIKQRIVLMTETRMLPRLDNVYKESLRPYRWKAKDRQQFNLTTYNYL